MGESARPMGRARGRWRAGPAAAAMLGALGLVLLVAWAVLTLLTGDLQASRDGIAPACAFACGLVGILVARRQPRNPEGWLLLSLAVTAATVIDSGLYAVLDYRIWHGWLPLGDLAVFAKGVFSTPVIFTFPLVILLFPDGRLTRWWKPVVAAYLGLVAVAALGVAAGEASILTAGPIRVDLNGGYSGAGSPAGALGALANLTSYGFVLILLFWPAFAARQVLCWRRSSGDQRQQLKWLTGGAVMALAGLLLIAFGPPKDQLDGRIARDLAFLCVTALPVSIGVGILKYHLYDIDRLISRTLAYALLTGVLVAVYAGAVTLATRVLPISSPLAVAAATLVVAALFNPLRRRLQRAVDRRFNRAGYDADATLAAFTSRLTGAVDLDEVQADLAGAVRQALEPAHVSVWLSPGGPG